MTKDFPTLDVLSTITGRLVSSRPTHWRPLTVDERFAEAAKLKKSSATSRDALNRALESLEMEGKP